MARNGITAGAAALALAAGAASGHGGAPGEHFTVGFYNGHDATFEAPAVPAWPDTLLVDTHPWELDGVTWFMPETTAPLLGDGWLTDIPGFYSLDAEGEEFGGHGYFSFEGSTVRAAIELVAIDEGLELLRPDLTPSAVGERIDLGTAPFHAHPQWFVAADGVRAIGDELTATLRVVDLSGAMQPSMNFDLVFLLGAACSQADLAEGYGTLDIFDVLLYFQYYAEGNFRAEFTGDAPASLDIFDILAFFDRFATGC